VVKEKGGLSHGSSFQRKEAERGLGFLVVDRQMHDRGATLGGGKPAAASIGEGAA